MEEGKGGIRSVERALAILDVLARHPDGIAPSPLAAELGLPVSTCHRLLSTLEQTGFAHRWAARGSYSVGHRLYALAAQSGTLDTIALSAARQTMERLQGELGETCNLAQREGLVARYVFQVASRTPVRLFTTVGSAVPLHSTGVGKVLLTDAPPDVIDSVALDLRPYTPTTITTREDLDEELVRIQEQGHALDNEEHQEGIMCVAVPIYDYAGALHASLSVAGPINRIKRSLDRIIPAAQTAGHEISSRLGWEADRATPGPA